MRNQHFALAALLIVVAMLAGCAGPATPQVIEKVVTRVVEKENVVQVVATQVVERAVEKPVVATATTAPKSGAKKVLRIASGVAGDVPTLDPALAQSKEVNLINMTNVGLTYLNQEDASTQPGLAEKWDIAPDGKTYTFHLRQGIPWVKWDANSQQVVKVQTCPDADGKTHDRTVTAQDFEYGILRALDPKTAAPYAYALNFVVDGAAAYNSGRVTDTKSVGVRALDPQTLEVKFRQPATYNASIIGLWVAHAAPRWLIEGDECTDAHGERWTETGFFQGYGPYTLKEWVHEASTTFVKNPFWPGTPAVPQARIDEITGLSALDSAAAFAEYEAGNVDALGTLPQAEMDRIKADPRLKEQLRSSPSTCTYYYGFNTRAPVVDDVRVRQALSLAIDRQALIDNVIKGGEEPAQWFCRPGLTGCPTTQDHPDLGVKYDPVKARALLDAYLKEKGAAAEKLDITLMYNTGPNHERIAEAIQQMWQQNLGIPVKVVSQEWRAYFQITKDPKETPQVWRNGWCADYPDANNFDREVVAFGGSQNPREGGGFNWQNPQFEDLVARAAAEMDPQKRADLYAQAEQILSWEDAVMIPLYWYTTVDIAKPYVTRTNSVTDGAEWNKWDMDMSQVK